jgi:hypothetical protein
MLRAAARDVRYLLDHGYPKEPSIRFVSDHYRLPQDQRFVLGRVVVPSEVAEARRRKIVPLEAVRKKRVTVDGYNVIITVESLLGGSPVYRCDDGFLRDVQGIFGNYETSDLTCTALSLILDLLASAGPAAVDFILDQQISKSGELAGGIRRRMAEVGMPGTARTVRDADRQLKSEGGIVASGDGNVIDSASCVVDLPGEMARIKGLEGRVL